MKNKKIGLFLAFSFLAFDHAHTLAKKTEERGTFTMTRYGPDGKTFERVYRNSIRLERLEKKLKEAQKKGKADQITKFIEEIKKSKEIWALLSDSIITKNLQNGKTLTIDEVAEQAKDVKKGDVLAKVEKVVSAATVAGGTLVTGAALAGTGVGLPAAIAWAAGGVAAAGAILASDVNIVYKKNALAKQYEWEDIPVNNPKYPKFHNKITKVVYIKTNKLIQLEEKLRKEPKNVGLISDVAYNKYMISLSQDKIYAKYKKDKEKAEKNGKSTPPLTDEEIVKQTKKPVL